MPRTHGINLSLPIDIHDPTFLTKKNTLKDVVVDLFKSHQTMSQTLQKIMKKSIQLFFDSVRSGVESQRELLMKLVDWKIQVDSDMKTQQSAFEKEEKLYNQTCNKYDKLFTKATRNKISCEEFIEIEKQTKLSTFQFCTHLNSTLQNLSSIFSRNGLLFVRNFSTYANNVHNLTVPPTTIPAIQLVQLELPENYSLPSHYGGLLVSKGGVCPSGKRYYNITNGNFVWYDENNNENIISEVMLIAVKPLPDIHSIEFFAPKGKSILYAPTTFEMNRWIEMFEKCKTDSSCYTESLRPTGESIIKMLRKIPGNDRCAECGKRDPDWMSATLGVIICLECSGAHRSLGVRTSRVKSILLDSIDADFILLLKKLGNSYINTTYLQSNRYICSPNATGPQRYASIREKYVIKKFMKSNNDDNGMDMTLTLQSNDIKKLMELLVHLKPGNIPKDAVVTACKMGHLDAVALLLLHGADVNGTDEDGNTGLHVAVMNQNSRMLATIMRHSPTLTVENKVNQSPIQLVSCAPFGNAQAIFDRYQQQQSPAPLSAETEEIHIAEILKEEM
ncbi:Centaurin beta [Entamoeba marina]